MSRAPLPTASTGHRIEQATPLRRLPPAAANRQSPTWNFVWISTAADCPRPTRPYFPPLRRQSVPARSILGAEMGNVSSVPDEGAPLYLRDQNRCKFWFSPPCDSAERSPGLCNAQRVIECALARPTACRSVRSALAVLCFAHIEALMLTPLARSIHLFRCHN